MNQEVDRKTLAWIKTEIEATLKSVHHVPGAFAENTEDSSLIEACIEPLHRVRGAVEMIGIEGATMLAHELEQLAQALFAKKVTHKKDAAEVLAAGMLQLPGYLEALYHGQPDIPLVLLPQLNNLRAVQNKELLTEGEFFSPNLSIAAPPQSDRDCIVSGDLSVVAKKLRPGYLTGLLGFIKNDNVTENLEMLIIVVDSLLLASTNEKARQLWWICSGVIDSLYQRGLESNIAIKILLGRVDQQIKRVIDHGEQVLESDPPDKICKNLLYYIAQSKSKIERVVELKQAFNLDYPNDDFIIKARDDLFGFNVNLIDTVSAQIIEELSRIKDALEIALHAKSGSTSDLEPVLKQFGAVTDALGMLGLTALKTLMRDYKEFLADKIQKQQSLTQEEFMSIAAALLHAESSLSDIGTTLNAAHSNSLVAPAEFKKILKLVAQEIIKDINKIKEQVNNFFLDSTNNALQENTIEILHQITGVMRLVRHKEQANLAAAIMQYVQHELIGNVSKVSIYRLDLLADAITGLEYYYQSILEESVAPEVALSIATRSITQLGYTPGDQQLDSPNQLEFTTAPLAYST